MTFSELSKNTRAGNSLIDELSNLPTTEIDLHCPDCGACVPTIEQLQQDIFQLKEAIDSLKQQALTDNLTGLFNYRHFSLALDQEMERSQRTGNTTGLIMVDLDFFKKVNDTYGHETGNQVLIHTAKLLKDAIRKLDVPCRYGGEEFAIILPSTDHLTTTQVANRLRKLIEDRPLQIGDDTLHLTASLGADVYSRLHTETQEGFIKRVDRLLYQAKHNGRNQVCSGKRKDLNLESNVTADEKSALNQLFSNNDSNDIDAGSSE